MRWRSLVALVFGLALLALALAAAVSLASFHAIDGPLNVDPSKDAFTASIADVGGVPYVAWYETNGSATQVRVKRFDGTSWLAVGGSLNIDPSKNAFTPSIATVGGVPYVAWHETNGTAAQVRVRRFDGTSWLAVGGSLNDDPSKNASTASIADVGGVPYVAWHETNGTATQVRVKRFDGTNWVAVGGSLNADPSKSAATPSIAGVGGVPYVAWDETNGTARQIRVKRFDGTSWLAVGGSLNVDPSKDAVYPSIAGVGGVPYVAWAEDNGTATQVRVERFDGTSWLAVGGLLNVDPSKNAFNPSIATVGGVPYVAWQESNGTVDQIRVKRFDGTSWLAVGGSLNADPTKSTYSPSIAGVGGAPYVAWPETNGTAYQIRVARDLAPSCSGGSVAVAHDTATSISLVCSDADGDARTLAIATGPAHGTLAAIDQAAGTVTYTPSSGYSGADSFSFKANDGALDSNLATMTLSVAPPAIPALSRLRVAPHAFAVTKRKSGATVSYRDTKAATTTFTVLKPAHGIKRGGTCVAPKKGQRGQRCTRYVAVGSFTHADRAGANSFHFSGRVGGRTLTPGSYRLQAVPRFAGRNGRPTRTSFRIIP